MSLVLGVGKGVPIRAAPTEVGSGGPEGQWRRGRAGPTYAADPEPDFHNTSCRPEVTFPGGGDNFPTARGGEMQDAHGMCSSGDNRAASTPGLLPDGDRSVWGPAQSNLTCLHCSPVPFGLIYY